MSMELRQLRYFLAVARTLSFTKAAAELHIAQPPLSRQVANLEAELGVELVERSPRGIKLTPAGALLVERANEILQKVERTKREVAAFNEKRRRLFKIGFDLSLLYGRTPRIFRFLRESYAEYDFEYAEVASADQVRAIRNREIDLALGLTLLVDDQVEQIVVRNEQLMLALAIGHPAFRGRDQPIKLSEVSNETLILYDERASGGPRHPVIRFIELVGFRPANTDDDPRTGGCARPGRRGGRHQHRAGQGPSHAWTGYLLRATGRRWRKLACGRDDPAGKERRNGGKYSRGGGPADQIRSVLIDTRCFLMRLSRS